MYKRTGQTHFQWWAGRLTARCDVYSFGVVLLELLSGRRAVDKTKVGVEQNLVDWAKPYLGDRRKVFRIMDTKLEGQYPQKGAFMVAILALQCISEVKLRPDMSAVLHGLEQHQACKNGSSPSHSEQPRGSSPGPKSPLSPNPSAVNISPSKSPLLKSNLVWWTSENFLVHLKSPVLISSFLGPFLIGIESFRSFLSSSFFVCLFC